MENKFNGFFLKKYFQELHLSLNDYSNVLIDTLEEDLFFEEDFEEETDKDEACTCRQETRETYKRSNYYFYLIIIFFSTDLHDL